MQDLVKDIAQPLVSVVLRKAEDWGGKYFKAHIAPTLTDDMSREQIDTTIREALQIGFLEGLSEGIKFGKSHDEDRMDK